MNISSFSLRSLATRTTKKRPGWSRFLPFDDSGQMFQALPSERIDVIRNGIHPLVVTHLAAELGVTRSMLCQCLGMSSASLSGKERSGKPLSPGYSERALGVLSLIGQVQSMVEESGDPEGFDAVQWFASWAFSPVSALGGNTPASYFDTMAGQGLVANLLASMQSGAYQ